MIFVRSLIFNAVFYLWSGLLMVLFLPLLVLPHRAALLAARSWSASVLFLLRVICGLSHEVRGLEHLPEGPYIVASKHQSAWDTIVFALLIDGPVYVFKRELLHIPLFGWYVLAAGCIPIDRTGGAAALRRMIARARAALDNGRKIVIFPEGTRVALGAHVPHHPGTAALYAQLGVPVVPVAVNSGLYWGRRTFQKRPGRIVLEFLPPIPPGMPRKAFAAELESRIESASNRLLAEADPASCAAIDGPKGP
jgi:1-acyl-sn-glycerol-3-phosphate acyltransferase